MAEETEASSGTLEFFREVTKYFMDFLESDFHKKRAPRRQLRTRNQDNLLVGIGLSKYPNFRNQCTKALRDGLPGSPGIQVRRDQYKTKLPPRVNELIQLQIQQLSAADLDRVVDALEHALQQQAILNPDQLDIGIAEVHDSAGAALFDTLVHPFIETIAKPLGNSELGGFSDIYVVERELTDVLLTSIESKLSDILTRLVTREAVDTHAELTPYFAIEDVRAALSAFFSELEISDLFLELFELERNWSILDKQDLYAYFGEIGFRGARYPIFYVPLQSSREDGTFNLVFDSQVYINKKAIEFIVQEVNALRGTQGGIPSITERIIYTSALGKDLLGRLNRIVGDICTHFHTAGTVDLAAPEEQVPVAVDVQVSNRMQLALFDKADEALVNDYEEILQELALDGGMLSDAFNRILEDFLVHNPEPFAGAVEDEWDALESADKLVSASPIPLNGEQTQILLAINSDGCKYITVEGPPGTGKSHTITAIIFDAVLKDKSVLVLSDKKEALDVVEKNITEAINRVRFDSDFQNPILRLGKTGNTYNKILSKSSMAAIKTHHRVVRKDVTSLEESIEQSVEQLKEDLELESLGLQEIDLGEVAEYFELQDEFASRTLPFDFDEATRTSDSIMALGFLRTGLVQANEICDSMDYQALLRLLEYSPSGINGMSTLRRALVQIDALADSWSLDEKNLLNLRLLPNINESTPELLGRRLTEFEKLRSPLFGFLFAKGRIRDFDLQVSRELQLDGLTPSSMIPQLKRLRADLANMVKDADGISQQYGIPRSLRTLLHATLTNSGTRQSVKQFLTSTSAIEVLVESIDSLPRTCQALGVEKSAPLPVAANRLLMQDEQAFERQLRYAQLHQRMQQGFGSIQEVNYGARKQSIELLVTTQVAHKFDRQVINFFDAHKNDAEMLRNVIKTKQKFPRGEFESLRVAFPCILAGIRDFAEYIPLQSEVFDLLIIDEASQVSLAQAFPALLRAKKVLILGDRKQFSNVKAAQARTDTNREYLYGLERSFRRNVSEEVAQLTRLGKFNIKTSVLEFFEFISNYSMQLVKHFRGYREIISYSNKYFYAGHLQVMKLRAKPADEVIKFTYVEAGSDDEPYPNTNLAEVRFIAAELIRLLEAKSKLSVGIITPHTNQQKLLVEQLGKMNEFPQMLSELQLKIMTFDTCQGEERDLIFYSMVATEKSDKLWGVFIKDLANVDVEEDGQIKAQRLNVGFSRGKECIHFVLSKPLDAYSGSIGEALRHYAQQLAEAKKELPSSAVDANSPMEAQVLQWFHQTEFWQTNKDQDRINFTTQFEIGKYLKQLDPTYTHPMYKVDFLLVYKDLDDRETKIVIEYDGFYEHFRGSSLVNEYNYETYQSDGDIYRQKVLESYGCKFLRINKFNSGANPVERLNKRLEELVKPEPRVDPLMRKLHKNIKVEKENLQSGNMKECPRCKEVRTIEEFKDPSLSSGMRRFCRSCKDVKVSSVHKSSSFSTSSRSCPECGARMDRVSGKFGSFYACSKYPYCKGTRP